MKYWLMMILLAGTAVYGQETKTTLTVEGRIKNPKVFSLEELKRYPAVQLDSLQIYNHLMVPHGIARHIKGVPLKELLKDIVFDAETPKVLSEYYIVCVAADNYKVVFSWNELFNSPGGDKVLVATEKDGVSAVATKDGLVLVTQGDRATGRRFVKELNKIIIQRVN